MLFNENLKRLCMAILSNSIGSEKFGHMLVEAGIKLNEEWDIPNKLLSKSEEISHAAGGKNVKIIQ